MREVDKTNHSRKGGKPAMIPNSTSVAAQIKQIDNAIKEIQKFIDSINCTNLKVLCQLTRSIVLLEEERKKLLTKPLYKNGDLAYCKNHMYMYIDDHWAELGG
jgi:hypothetical protein